MRDDDTQILEGWIAGRIVAGRYRLRSPVGAGAMGVVWEADDLRLDRAVALKQLRLPPGLPAVAAVQARRRVFREAHIAAQLQHPNAVGVFDVTADDHGQPILVLEYLPSRSLADVLDGQGSLRPLRVARIGAAVASALAEAHAVGIVHRDVKPANILLCDDGTAKITDFGLSYLTGEATSEGWVAGTPVFLSPEAARGEVPSPESDVFSLGATLYMAVEGTPPFGVADDPQTQLERVADGQAPPPRRAGQLTRILTRMLHDDPDERPAMAEVEDVLTNIAAEWQPIAVTDTLPALNKRAAAGRRLRYIALALIAIGLLTVLVIRPLTNDEVGGGDGSSSPPPPTGATTTTTQSAPAPPAVTGAPLITDPSLMTEVVTQFYALLPGDAAFALLGPGLDQARVAEFWAGVKDLQIVTEPQVSGNTVVVEVDYVQPGRGRVRETHLHEILLRDGTALINSDQVVATPEPNPGKKNGN